MNNMRYSLLIIFGLSLLTITSCSSVEKNSQENEDPAPSVTIAANMQENEPVIREQTEEENAPAIPEIKWSVKKNAPTKATSYGFVSATLDDIVYVLVLESPDVFLYRYEPETDTWSEKIPLKSKRLEIHSAAALDGKIYHYGGLDINHEQSDSIEEFDPSTNTSRIITDAEEMDSIMKAIKGSILLEDVKLPGSPDAWRYGPYILNGKEFIIVTEPGAWINHIYEFDSEQKIWIKKAKMPSNRADFTIQVMDDKIITLGGWTDGSTLSDAIEIYDPVTDKWTELEKMDQPQWCMAPAYVKGKLYLIGGKTTGWADETGGYTDTVMELEIN